MSPIKTIRSGSRREVRPLTATSTSSSKLSAICINIFDRSPVSSPILTILVTSGGNALLVSMGPDTLSPSLMLSLICITALPINSFPIVSRTVSSAASIGTPLESKVPRVLENLATAICCIKFPTTGMRSFILSITILLSGFFIIALYIAITQAGIRGIRNHMRLVISLTTINILVGSGKFPPSSENILVNVGITKTISIISISTATIMTNIGYISADFTLSLSFCALSRNSDNRLSMPSSMPPSSPAFIMFT